MKKVAIIGSGISGTSAAYYLNKFGYNVSIFECSFYLHASFKELYSNKTRSLDPAIIADNLLSLFV